ncbi:MAG TPA: class I SAM-dependent methyltransferase [Bryobacteraceae bacterium]|nr:class I SAM-dependent methyltransferase [Bryobacteraceae bacterium]
MITASAGLAAPATVMAALACPKCRARAIFDQDRISCTSCGASYAVSNGVIDLRPPATAQKYEEIQWTEHWASGNQQSTSQRFFSFYRKAVFARAVAYFVGRYLPKGGVLVEAGCGTAETSILIDKENGARTLVALDLIQPILEHCHPVMDVRICGDIFALPFLDNSVDGIWNVGVMEHFTHAQIDAIMKEFHRVLKPGSRVILLWPATFSIPQRILRVLEWFINMRRDASSKFRFHPDEISQLRSVKQGRDVLIRNGFRPAAIDIGLRTLMAFETLVGAKA